VRLTWEGLSGGATWQCKSPARIWYFESTRFGRWALDSSASTK
jgi:hypothetical protein